MLFYVTCFHCENLESSPCNTKLNTVRRIWFTHCPCQSQIIHCSSYSNNAVIGRYIFGEKHPPSSIPSLWLVLRYKEKAKACFLSPRRGLGRSSQHSSSSDSFSSGRNAFQSLTAPGGTVRIWTTRCKPALCSGRIQSYPSVAYQTKEMSALNRTQGLFPAISILHSLR